MYLQYEAALCKSSHDLDRASVIAFPHNGARLHDGTPRVGCARVNAVPDKTMAAAMSMGARARASMCKNRDFFMGVSYVQGTEAGGRRDHAALKGRWIATSLV
jgi:hypothetical protein